MLAAACVAGVNLCRALTYLNIHGFFGYFKLLTNVIDDLKVVFA